ncbi:MAG: site-specific integrase, partial [Actinomycetota bacterium]|nr:site-specific integrase [Actinomycetota bacterium]
GASIKGVQAMLGHASATLTLDRYGHLLGDELDGLAARLDAAVSDSRAACVRPGAAPEVVAMPSARAGNGP